MSHIPAHPVLRTWSLFQQSFVLSARYFDTVTARFGLSFPQTAVLTVLRQHERSLPLSHIARILTQEAQSTTELADRLERRGFVRRVRDPRDRRLVLLELTAEGSAVIDQILPALHEAGEHLFRGIDAELRPRLEQMLTSLRDTATAHLQASQDHHGLARPRSSQSTRS